MSQANLIFVLGTISLAWGISMWMGWLPTVRRTNMLKGGVHPDMMVIGAGMVLIGSTGFVSSPALGLLGLALFLAGIVVWVTNPKWLLPGWYKRRYPDEPPRGSAR